MFWSSTIIRELIQSMAKVVFLLKHAVKNVIIMWRCGSMSWNGVCVVNRNIILARLCTISLMMVEDRNM